MDSSLLGKVTEWVSVISNACAPSSCPMYQLLSLPSYRSLFLCGTLNVTKHRAGNRSGQVVNPAECNTQVSPYLFSIVAQPLLYGEWVPYQLPIVYTLLSSLRSQNTLDSIQNLAHEVRRRSNGRKHHMNIVSITTRCCDV